MSSKATKRTMFYKNNVNYIHFTTFVCVCPVRSFECCTIQREAKYWFSKKKLNYK